MAIEPGPRPRARRSWLLLCSLGFFAAGAANACEVWRDEHGFFRGNCKLSAIFKERFVLDVAFLSDESRYRLRLTDLHPRKFKFQVFDRNVEVYVDVQNLGVLATRTVDAAVMLTVTDPGNGNSTSSSSNLVVPIPTIQPGSEQRVYVTTLTLPDRNRDWDITAVVAVDPPTPSSPMWGATAESDETNNTLTHTCRTYGLTPDTSVTACN